MEGLITTGPGLNCAIEQLSLSYSGETKCQGKMIATPQIWVTKLQSENHWLYTVDRPTKIRAICQSRQDIQFTTISGSGTFSITEPCDLEVAGLTLKYSRKIITKLNLPITKVGKEINVKVPEWINSWGKSKNAYKA